MTELDTGQKTSRRLWITAAIVALALHGGGAALALSYLATDEVDDSLGAPAIEIGLELTSPRKEASDLPPGPDSDASVATPAVAEQKAEPKETELPVDTPTETEDPDRVVTTNDAKKPVEDDTKVATVETQASEESVAAKATATPSLDSAPVGPRSVAPAQGMGKDLQRVKASWVKKLVAHLDKHLVYPEERDNKAANITLALELDRMGHVVSASVVEGSGDPAFDRAALAMVRRSDPVPPPPPVVADDGLKFTLPVIFRKH